jgi:hypothetical protein
LIQNRRKHLLVTLRGEEILNKYDGEHPIKLPKILDFREFIEAQKVPTWMQVATVSEFQNWTDLSHL